MSLRVFALPKGVRRGPETLLGLALVLGGGLAALALRNDSASLISVVGAVRPLESGHVITADDLGTFKVPDSTRTQFLDEGDADDVLGTVLVGDVLQPGPLPAALLSRPDTSLPVGQALHAVALDDGHFPPSIAVGHNVVVTLRSQQMDGRVDTTSLERIAVVAAVSPPHDLQPKAIITLRAPLQFAEDMAAAELIHLSIVRPKS
jgi:hypothetical protein